MRKHARLPGDKPPGDPRLTQRHKSLSNTVQLPLLHSRVSFCARKPREIYEN